MKSELYLYGSALHKGRDAADLDLVLLGGSNAMFAKLECLSRACGMDIDLKLNPPGNDFAQTYCLRAGTKVWKTALHFTGSDFFLGAERVSVPGLARRLGVSLGPREALYAVESQEVDEDLAPLGG